MGTIMKIKRGIKTGYMLNADTLKVWLAIATVKFTRERGLSNENLN
jgi:hypothetical protein